MAGKVIGKSMNYGYAGNYARTPDDIVASRKLNDSSADVAFGEAVVLNSDNTFAGVSDSTVAADIAGVALRIVKQADNYANQNIVSYVAGEQINVIERGAVTVVVNNGTPAAGAAVYVRVKANSSIPAGVVGGFEAAADGSNTIQVTNMVWTNGYVDANGVAELTILNRVKP